MGSSPSFRPALCVIISFMVLQSVQESIEISSSRRESKDLRQNREQFHSNFQLARRIATMNTKLGADIARDHANTRSASEGEIKISIPVQHFLTQLWSTGAQTLEDSTQHNSRRLPMKTARVSSVNPLPCRSTVYLMTGGVEREENKSVISDINSSSKCSGDGCNGAFARTLKQAESAAPDKSVVLILENGLSGEESAAPKESRVRSRSIVLITSDDPPSEQDRLISPEYEPEVELDEIIQTSPSSSKSVVLILADKSHEDTSEAVGAESTGTSPAPEFEEDLQINDSFSNNEPEQESDQAPTPEDEEDLGMDNVHTTSMTERHFNVVPTPEDEEDDQIDDDHVDNLPEEQSTMVSTPEDEEGVLIEDVLSNNLSEQKSNAAPIPEGEEVQIDDVRLMNQTERESDVPPTPEVPLPLIDSSAPAVEDTSIPVALPADHFHSTESEDEETSDVARGDVLLELHFEDLDYDTIVDEGELEQAMKEFILSSIASYGNLHEEDVAVVGIRRGSVIVDTSLVLHEENESKSLLEDLSNNPKGVFLESPYGIPEVSIIGGSYGNQFLQSVRGTIQDSTLKEQDLQGPEPLILPTKQNGSEAVNPSDAAGLTPRPGVPVSGSDDFGYAVVRLTFDWLNIMEDEAKAVNLRSTVISVMSQANGTYQGHVDIVDFVPEELSTKVDVKVSMATGNSVYDYQELFEVLDLDPPQPQWVFGDTFTYGEFLHPRVSFIEIGNEEGAVFTLESSAVSKKLATSLVLLLVFLVIM